MTDPMQIGSEPHPIADRFITDLGKIREARVAEFGTRRWDPDLTTHHEHWLLPDAKFVRVDITAGDDVDVVLDAHDLAPWFDDGRTDAIIAVAVYEHLRWPWVAAGEMARILRPGGLMYVQTHMAFPEHGTYGGDFTRWTRDGLAALFEWAGLVTVDASHTYPCTIVPPDDVANGRWNPGAPAWLCVDGYFRKPGA